VLKKFLVSLAAFVAVLGGLTVASSPAQAAGGPYYYAGFSQDLTAAQEALATEVKANVTAYAITTTLGTHALGEISVHTDDGATPIANSNRNGVVELGYTQANGSGLTIFVSRFVNSVWGGSYVGSGDGFVKCTKVVPYTCASLPANLSPGDALTSGTAYAMFLAYKNVGQPDEGWWLGANPQSTGCPAGKTCWLGYYPKALWSAASPAVSFTKPAFVQAFGEVHNTAAPASVCTNMADGNFGGPATGGVIGSVSYTGLPTSDVNLNLGTTSDPSMYSAFSLSGRTFRYGGPGSC
jgi:hypothetical protein